MLALHMVTYKTWKPNVYMNNTLCGRMKFVKETLSSMRSTCTARKIFRLSGTQSLLHILQQPYFIYD